MNNMDTSFADDTNDIAVIGLSCRFPGAQNYHEYWQNLISGTETVRHFSDEELLAAGVDPDLLNHPDYVKAQGVLDDIKGFDAEFFGISPTEAEIIDPQHRLFLEQSWAALEDAGYDPDQFDGRIGIYGGSGLNSYLLRTMMENPQAVMDKGPYMVLAASDKDYMCTRVSYKMNLKGTSLSVSTACSTSLVAIDLACQSLLSYQNDMVLAGGVTLQVPHISGYLYEEGGTQSNDGHCRAFDANSSGLVGGSGVGLIVLKRLEDAIRDQDRILAIIKGSATNNDGALKAGYTSPSVEGQAEVIAEAQANADVHPETIQYIEAHGTGTRLGDPIEVKALSKAFRAKTDKTGFCKIGSVKTNMGHLDSAAGIAGLIKTVLSLHHRQIPPSLHFERPNPEIDFENSPFVVNTTLCDWPTPDNTPRRAGVSSFGIGGTNAHVIVEEAPNMVRKKSTTDHPVILPLSAKNENALHQACDNLASYLKNNPNTDLNDVAFTLQQGRKTFDYRKGVVCHDIPSAIDALQKVLNHPAQAARPVQTVFMFPGQGAQYLEMGKGLYANFPVFRHALDKCADILLPKILWDIRDYITGHAKGDIKRTDIAQPLLFSLEYALAQLLKSFDIKPDKMIGHSLGEYVCATLAGVFTLKDALELVALRGELMQKMEKGDMLAVALSPDEIADYLSDKLNLAAHNAPDRCVISGPTPDIAILAKELANHSIESTLLHTSHAFHSGAMEPMLDEFSKAISRLERHVPTLPFIANLTGKFITNEQAQSVDYWVDHLRHTVQFADGLKTLQEQGNPLFIEVGPGTALSHFAKLTLQTSPLSTMRHIHDDKSDTHVFMETIAACWEKGCSADWSEWIAPNAQRIGLPTYPFQHKPYWITTADQNQKNTHSPHVKDWFYIPSWKREAPLCTASVTNGLTLVFMDQTGVGTQITQQFENTICVYTGTKYRKLNARSYEIRPAEKGDYVALLNDLERLPDAVIHGWSLDVSDNQSLEHMLDQGFYSLINLIQAIGLREDPLSLHILCKNLNDVNGQEPLCAKQALILGPLRVIPVEHPHIQCKAIDLCDDTPIDQIMAEINQPSAQYTNGQLIALRGSHRWSPCFEQTLIDDSQTTHLREGGTYMIAGGLNGIGLELARTLAQTYHANLALCGTANLPDRSDWGNYLKNQHTASETLLNLDGIDPVEIEQQIDQSLGIQGIETYDGFVEKVDRLCSLYICRFFGQSGLDMTTGQSYSHTDLIHHFAIQDKFIKLFNYILKVLVQDHIIARHDNQITFLKNPIDADDPQPLHNELIAQFPDFKAIFDVFEHCMKDYAKALNGEIEAVGVLFPGGGESIWDKATKAIPEHTRHRVYTEMARDLMLEKIAKNPNKTVRILELGAGAGVFTDVVLPALKGKNVEYTFTDIGKSFVLKAERNARENRLDFMKFGLLDISKDPIAQEFDANRYDIILELDCVHATHQMRETMAQVKKILAPDGMVLFVESVVTQRWMNLPLGLLEGWWYFQDEDLRQDSPLLTLEKWESLFQECGFKVATYPQSGQRRNHADCGLIVGEKVTSGAHTDPIAQKIHNIQELESFGAHVLPLCADISDKAAMKSAISKTEETFGPLHGFIQTAAFENRGPILSKVKSPHANEFLPKVQGSRNVIDLLGDKGLDFILLSSSHSAYDVGAGDVEYCSSNAFVDHFAAQQARKIKTPVLAVNWDRWRGVGMAQAYETMMKKRLGHIPVGGMSTAQGCETFKRILSLHTLPSQVVISTCDFNERTAHKDILHQNTKDPLSTDISNNEHTRSALLGEYTAAQTDSQKQMIAVWQNVLAIPQIGIEDNFYDLGGDSLIAIKVLSRLRDVFAVELSVNDLFERPTVKQLSERLEVMSWAQDESDTDCDEMEEGVL
ncbi:MAG: beta-ketoacyl synthase N-terminal-like domain-containing protein [Terasakiella sp.]|uniref:beta-ketoacyl synthase N-terminal-like domain-containing protein n=1 Tax=unclassified Terasakiella TaxID=2614952 RepID=UPI003B006569